jgi:HK97 family phage prohead protease
VSEKRAINFEQGEVRFKDNDKRTLEGYASVFNTPTDLGSFSEVIEAGAFTRALDEGQDVRALVEHDPARIIGRTKNNTLELREDQKGLFTRIDLPDTSVGRDLAALVERGDIDAMSFGFTVRSDRWERSEGKNVRIIEDVDLFDISAVSFPAYPDTEIALRSMPEDKPDDLRRRRLDIRLHDLRKNSWRNEQ